MPALIEPETYRCPYLVAIDGRDRAARHRGRADGPAVSQRRVSVPCAPACLTAVARSLAEGHARPYDPLMAMNVRIVYCHLCYAKRAHALGEELRRRFDATVEVVEGKLGQFDVLIDGKVAASRGQSFVARMMPRDAPASAAVVAAIEAHLSPREDESCALPPTEAKQR